MRGYCSRCKEYRSDQGENAWGMVWRDSVPTCEKCGSFVDVWEGMGEERGRGREEGKNRQKRQKTAENNRGIPFSHSKRG